MKTILKYLHIFFQWLKHFFAPEKKIVLSDELISKGAYLTASGHIRFPRHNRKRYNRVFTKKERKGSKYFMR